MGYLDTFRALDDFVERGTVKPSYEVFLDASSKGFITGDVLRRICVEAVAQRNIEIPPPTKLAMAFYVHRKRGLALFLSLSFASILLMVICNQLKILGSESAIWFLLTPFLSTGYYFWRKYKKKFDRQGIEWLSMTHFFVVTRVLRTLDRKELIGYFVAEIKDDDSDSQYGRVLIRSIHTLV